MTVLQRVASRSARALLGAYVPARTKAWPETSRLFVVGDEVDELRWLGPDDALACLTYDHDRDLVLMAFRQAAEDG